MAGRPADERTDHTDDGGQAREAAGRADGCGGGLYRICGRTRRCCWHEGRREVIKVRGQRAEGRHQPPGTAGPGRHIDNYYLRVNRTSARRLRSTCAIRGRLAAATSSRRAPNVFVATSNRGAWPLRDLTTIGSGQPNPASCTPPLSGLARGPKGAALPGNDLIVQPSRVMERDGRRRPLGEPYRAGRGGIRRDLRLCTHIGGVLAAITSTRRAAADPSRSAAGPRTPVRAGVNRPARSSAAGVGPRSGGAKAIQACSPTSRCPVRRRGIITRARHPVPQAWPRCGLPELPTTPRSAADN